MGGYKSKMRDYRLSPAALVMVQGSSKGTQPKYYEDGYWYKVNNVGYEGLAERLASMLHSHSNIKNFVEYEQCMINGRPGCRSKNFVQENESFISFQRLYELYTGENLHNDIRVIADPGDRIRYVVDFVFDHTGLDCSEYLSQILTLDMLILNTDRHFNNLGIIVDAATGICGTAPIFDNGDSLLSDWERFHKDTLEENIDLVYGQPFASSLEAQARYAGIGLAVDYDGLELELENENDSRGLQVLRYQLARYKEIIPDLCLRDKGNDALRWSMEKFKCMG